MLKYSNTEFAGWMSACVIGLLCYAMHCGKQLLDKLPGMCN